MTGEATTADTQKGAFWSTALSVLSGGGFGKTYQAAQIQTQQKQDETDSKTLYLLLFFILLMFGGTAFFILKK